jgi:drug/metabolite transporter, DME family
MVNRRAVALAVGTAVTWGLAGTLIRLVSVFPAVFVTGLRLAIATVAVLPVIYLWRNRLSLSDLRRPSTYALAALLVAYYLTAVFAFQMAPVAEVALLIASSPLLVLGANLLRGVTISRGERFGALLACIGVAFVLGPRLSPGSFQIRYLAGELLALLSAACSAGFATLFGRPRPDGSKSPDPLMVALTTFIAGGAALNAVAFAFLPIDLSLLRSPRVFVPALALGIISTAFPSLAYSTAARSLPPVLTTTIQLLIPDVSTFAAAIVLRELPSVWFIPGGTLVLGGIAILVRSASSPAVVREEEFTNL